MSVIKILRKIWPWTRIADLKRELADSNKLAQFWRAELLRVDPYYEYRMFGAERTVSPRTNVCITNIGYSNE